MASDLAALRKTVRGRVLMASEQTKKNRSRYTQQDTVCGQNCKSSWANKNLLWTTRAAVSRSSELYKQRHTELRNEKTDRYKRHSASQQPKNGNDERREWVGKAVAFLLSGRSEGFPHFPGGKRWDDSEKNCRSMGDFWFGLRARVCWFFFLFG